MSGPYGIEQLDIPGIYGAVQNAHMGRIQQMLGERQIAAADRQAERDNQWSQTLAGLYGRAAPTGVNGQPAGAHPAVAAYGQQPPGPGQPAVTPPGVPGADPAGTPPPPQQMQINQAAVADLYRQDPVRAAQTMQAVNQMNAAQLEQAHGRLQALAPIYASVAQIPYGTDGAARRAYIQSILPQIQQMGIDPNEAAGFDPTDQALNAHMSLGMTMDQVISSARGHPMVAPSDSSIVDPDHIDPVTGQPRVLYESPTVMDHGVRYPRPQSMRQIPQRPLTDEEIRRLDQGGAGQPNAQSTFPGRR